ncbi:MFS transporter [Prodigiosinella aquatilis]|nr:MFS transporter [Prodigiosinella sp. LS101]WJV55341.1 MFS transporter [Prodigiosinella sp. LS101]WJV59703.1 MFS transporter [Pectobacteriaceae bacterium C111]
MANSYREMLTTPGVMGLVFASFIVRLPQAMIGIGIITMLAEQRGLYWLAGSVAATFTLANALIGPHVSKFVDRHGQSRVLPVITAFSIVMLLALLIAAYMKVAAPFLFILAALAGTMPNMPAMIRARWTELFRGKPQLHTAFSLDTALTELSYIVGPVLAIALSTSVFAEAGPLAAVLLLVIGMTAFLLQRQTEPKVVSSGRGIGSSTLRIPGLRIIFLALMAMGVIGGSIDVAVVAFANAQHWPTAASFILAAYAFGSVISGLAFGAFRITLPLERQFLIGILVTAVTAILPILSPDVYIMTGMVFVASLSFAPTMVVVMNLGTIIVPPSKLTEGLTWMTTGISIGVALGSALSGRIIDAFGARAGFGVPIVAGLVMVMVVLIGFRTLRAASETHEVLTFR